MKTEIKTPFGKIEWSEQHELLTLKEKPNSMQRIMYSAKETRLLRDFLNQLDVPGILPTIPLSEKQILEQINVMCMQSLDPETSDMWDAVKAELMANRMLLKNETLKPLPKIVLDFLDNSTK